MDFNREEHIYTSQAFDEIIKDTIRFFNGTPVITLPPSSRFSGTGVYALYYIGSHQLYEKISEKNRMEFTLPIYVGKAVPRGWRQARVDSQRESFELINRIKEHSRSIDQVNDLELDDFRCRFIILEGTASNLISTVEAALIRFYQPIWNTILDGFGNHDPGKGRYNQAKSDWDVIHNGRTWANKCLGEANNPESIKARVNQHFVK